MAIDKVWARMEADLSLLVETESPEMRSAVTKLLQAEVLHAATAGRADAGNIDRYGYMLAIKAAIEAFGTHDDVRLNKLTDVFVRMLADFEDLERGRVARALRPRPRSRKDTGPRSRIISTQRGHLAGIIEGLMRRGGMSEPEAAHWVQRQLSARGIKLSTERLIQWRKEARGKKTDDFMRVAYHKANTVDWREPIAAASQLIENFLRLT